MEIGRDFRCVSHCCLCLFDFCDGDRAIRLRQKSEPNPADPTKATVVFDYETLIFDPENPRSIPPRQWHRSRPPVFAAHLDCYEKFPPFDPTRLFFMIHYAFQPPQSSKLSRESFLRENYLSALGAHGDISLGTLREQARRGVRKFLLSPAIPKNRTPPFVFVVDASKPIWGFVIMFEGHRYLRYITNTPYSNAISFLSAEQGPSFDRLYYAEDHLGIRGLFFSERDMSLHEQPGIWWTQDKATGGQRLLQAYSDGFKIRDLRLVQTPNADGSPRTRWSLLPPKPETVWILNLDERARGIPYFKPLELDNPKIFGYSACMLDGDLVDIHSHGEGKDLSFYHEKGGDRSHAVWLYFPVEEDERIVEVWRLKRKPRFCRDIPILRTNKGRVWILGTQTATGDSEAKFERVTLFTKTRPCHFWYNYHGDGIDHLAFDSEDKRMDKNEVSRVLQGPYALCASGAGPQAFGTSARLENVVRVIPCQSWSPRSTGIVGLLFFYSDGHCESVGQVRLDHLLPPLQVDPAGDMWLGAREIQHGGTVIESMRVIPSDGETINGGNPSEVGLRWTRVTWQGHLDWQFWYGRCFVGHVSHSVPGRCMTISRLFETWAGREWEEEGEEEEEVMGQLVVRARS